MDTSIDKLHYAADYLAHNSALQQALELDSAELCADALHFLGKGEHNCNFWFARADGTRFVLRINVIPQPFHEDQVAYEFAALQALSTCGRAPKPLYLDNSHEIIEEGVLVIGFCPGTELDFDNLRPGDLTRATNIMADIHAVPVADDAPLYHPKDPLRALFDECIERFELYRKSAFENARITAWVERMIDSAFPLLETPFKPEDTLHVVNTETLPSHFLLPENVTKDTEAHGGYFVDWERAIIGEPAQDVAYFTAPTTTFWDSDYLFTRNEAAEFIERYWSAVDGRFPRGNFDKRFWAYRAMTALRSTTWFCKALSQYTPEPTGYTTEKTTSKFETYLSDEFLDFVFHDCFEK